MSILPRQPSDKNSTRSHSNADLSQTSNQALSSQIRLSIGRMITLPGMQSVVVAALSGLPADALAYPFFTVRTLQQASLSKSTSSVAILKNVTQESGVIKGMYRGFSISALTAVPATGLYLAGMDLSFWLFGSGHLGTAMQGPLAQASASLIWGPGKRFMELQQAAKHGSSFQRLSILGKFSAIYKESGFLGLYQGTLPQYLSFSFCNAIAFWVRGMVLSQYDTSEQNQFLHRPLPQALVFHWLQR